MINNNKPQFRNMEGCFPGDFMDGTTIVVATEMGLVFSPLRITKTKVWCLTRKASLWITVREQRIILGQKIWKQESYFVKAVGNTKLGT
jgi:hypothetical protein